jgi:hypothetical protein
MTYQEIIANEEAARAAYEAATIVTTNGLSIADLRKRMDAVQDPANWKNPISKFVGAVDPVERRNISDAIKFFAGCVAEWESSNGGRNWTVKAAGYYAAVGA